MTAVDYGHGIIDLVYDINRVGGLIDRELLWDVADGSRG